MGYKPISDYGIIGDMHSAAVVGLDGSIDWLCFPRFDSPSVFAAILDDEKGGRFRLSPTDPHQSEQRYLQDTNILCTTFTTDKGRVEIQDFMPLKPDRKQSDHEVLRIVRGVHGAVQMNCLFQPRLDYARGRTKLRVDGSGVVAEQGATRLALSSPVDLVVANGDAAATFAVQEGEELVFWLRWDAEEPPSTAGWRDQLEHARKEWQGIVTEIGYSGRWRDDVVRSVLTLHLLVYSPTGSLTAAATTSLPEWIGGDRNWDYRFCWIRDASFTLDVFDRLGHIRETTEFLNWLFILCESCGVRLQPLYGVRLQHEEDLTEFTLDHLEGYRGSKPVRVGNAASNQLQLDIFGEVIIACSTFHRAGGEIPDHLWEVIESLVHAVIDNWRRPDRGMWEVRGEMRHFVHSKVMCWLALDRAIPLAETLGKGVDLDGWRTLRDEIHADVLERGWNEQLESFVQYYGAEHTDAALLMIPMVGFLPAEDPRMRSTVDRIRAELEVNGLLRRYLPAQTDDGFDSDEGVFTMCTFWLIGYLTFINELDEACALFKRVLDCSNHLGLFSEMLDPKTGEALGNFPQAFTHVSLIHTARNLDLALQEQQQRTTEATSGLPGNRL